MKTIASSICRRAKSNGLAVLAALLCAACGTESSSLFNISGQVVLGQDANGEPQILVSATVTRSLPDGGTEAVPDADVALNGVPLGPGTVDGPPGQLTWRAPSFPGAIALGHQTLSVIGSSASVSFDCPPAISFLEPVNGASVDRNRPLPVAWTAGGSAELGPLLVTSYSLTPQASNGPLVLAAGLESFPPGSNGAQVTVPRDIPAGGDLFLTINVYGDGSDYASFCAAAPRLHLIVP